MGKPEKNKTLPKKDQNLKLNMTFEEAMKKALNTPLPTKKAKKKS
jgi:hypothetical protein